MNAKLVESIDLRLNLMMPNVFRAGHQFKVFKPVVGLDSILVVDRFSGPNKLSTKMLLHKPTMLWDKLLISVQNYVAFLAKMTRASIGFLHLVNASISAKPSKMHLTISTTLVLFVTFIKLTYSHAVNYMVTITYCQTRRFHPSLA